MKCSACNQEVALARVCPYCGAAVEASGEDAKGDEAPRGPRGEFRGPVGGGAHARPAGGRPSTLAQVMRFFADPRVPGWKKTGVLAILFYILSPIDFLPGALFPVVGWFDDAALVALAWRWIQGENTRLDREL